MTGIAIYKNFDWLLPYLKDKAIIWLGIYATYIVVFKFWLKVYDNNYEISIWGILSNSLLSLLTLSFAFSFTDLSKKLLRENDISYGIYIYHMPIVNTMVGLGYKGSIWYLLILAIQTTILAFFSWKLIEKRILKLKM